MPSLPRICAMCGIGLTVSTTMLCSLCEEEERRYRQDLANPCLVCGQPLPDSRMDLYHDRCDPPKTDLDRWGAGRIRDLRTSGQIPGDHSRFAMLEMDEVDPGSKDRPGPPEVSDRFRMLEIDE